MNSFEDAKNTREIQKKLLEILVYFSGFCNDHNLSFTLAGGTALGAVRHGGFIPWDDDVDVFMLREDYEKLRLLWDKYADTDRYSCVWSTEKENIHHSATEIKDNNTTFINKHSVDLDINHGLMIDVIPLDDVGDTYFKQVLQIIESMVFCAFNFQRLPNHKSKLVYWSEKIALSVVKSKKLRYLLWKTAEKRYIKHGSKKSGLVASFGEGYTIMRQRFPREWFENPVYFSFEGCEMPLMNNYDQWLTVSYGDYMQLPPENERVARHDTAFIDLKHSYLKYKGIKYCVKKSGD